MSTFGKILVVVNLGLAGAFLGSAANYLGHQDTFSKKLADAKAEWSNKESRLNDEISQKAGALAAANSNLNAATKERDAAQIAASRADAQNKNLIEGSSVASSNLTVANRSMEVMAQTAAADKARIASLSKDREALKEALDAVTQNRDQTAQLLAKVELELEMASRLSKQSEQNLVTAQEQIRQLEFQIAAYGEKHPGSVTRIQPAQSGRVIQADASANVVVISLGEEDGVKRGYRFTVARGNDFVGTIQIDDVQAKQSSGYVVRDLSKGEVRSGDNVFNAN